VIYFIQAQDSKSIKIGYTDKNPAKRLSALQTGSVESLKLLFCIEGNIDAEKQLHAKYSQHRLCGEWFTFEGDLKRFVLEHWGRVLSDLNRKVSAEEYRRMRPNDAWLKDVYFSLHSITEAMVLQECNEDEEYPCGYQTIKQWDDNYKSMISAIEKAHADVLEHRAHHTLAHSGPPYPKPHQTTWVV
jgi:hypothetical protein